jgi:hypothetical protein
MNISKHGTEPTRSEGGLEPRNEGADWRRNARLTRPPDYRLGRHALVARAPASLATLFTLES